MDENEQGIMMIMGDDGVFREYNDEFDITIHCESQEEAERVMEKLKQIKLFPEEAADIMEVEE